MAICASPLDCGRTISRPRLREQGIRLRWNEQTGYDECLVEDRMATDRGLVGLGNAGESFDEFGRGRHYEDLNPAGFDARERVKVLDAEGIDVAVMYPGLGLKLGAIQDRDLAVESCKVYNDWLAEWCAQSPDRLVGVGALPLQDPKRAADEARRIAPLGLKAGFARPNAYNDRPLHHPVVHAGVGGAVGDGSSDRVPSGRPGRHAGRVAGARRASWRRARTTR